MRFHHNFGVSEHNDPLDTTLLNTVANLKHPPRIPTENEPERTSDHLVADLDRINPSLGVHATEEYIEG